MIPASNLCRPRDCGPGGGLGQLAKAHSLRPSPSGRALKPRLIPRRRGTVPETDDPSHPTHALTPDTPLPWPGASVPAHPRSTWRHTRLAGTWHMPYVSVSPSQQAALGCRSQYHKTVRSPLLPASPREGPLDTDQPSPTSPAPPPTILSPSHFCSEQGRSLSTPAWAMCSLPVRGLGKGIPILTGFRNR